MKRDYVTMTIAIIAIILGLFTFINTPQGLVETQTNLKTLDKIKETSTLNVCYGEYAPAIIKDPNTGKLSGHTIDFIESMGEQIGVEINYIETTWGGASADLISKRCDLMSIYFNKIPRAYSIAFTDPIMYIGSGALVRKNDERFKNIKSIYELDKEEYTIVVSNGESGHLFVQENFKNAKIEVIDSQSGDLLKHLSLVQTGRADIGIMDTVSLNQYSLVHNDVEDIFKNNAFNLNSINMAVRQEDTVFLNFLNNVISVMHTEDKFREFEKKYDANWIYKNEEYSLN